VEVTSSNLVLPTNYDFWGWRLKIGGSRRTATVSVRTARETGKAIRIGLGGSPTAKIFLRLTEVSLSIPV